MRELFGRLTLLGRLTLIVLLLLLALAALGVAVDFAAKDRRVADRFPVPKQAAAIVEHLDALAPEQRAAALRAVETAALRVAVLDALPAPFRERRRMPAVEWLVGQYLDQMTGRQVRAAAGAALSDGPIEARDRIHIAVSLTDGRHAVFEVRGHTPRRVYGAPPGFFIGAVGCVFAALALWAIAREARPLRRLAQAVKTFGETGAPQPVEPRGAPEIRRLIEAANAMQARLAALIRGRTVMIGAISHDLKTYITRLRLRVEGVADPAQRDKAAADLDEMTALIEDAIALARGAAEAGRREPVALAPLLREAIAAREDAALTLEVASEAEAAVVAGDPVGLRRLFANLLDNALRYGSRAAVDLTRDGAAVRVRVDDDGPGVPEAERAAIFEPFVRLEPSRSRATGGGGLGLAIAKQLADAHGGEIAIAHSPLGGARFLVSLPAASEPALDPSRARRGS